MKCAQPGCAASAKDDRWAKIKAHDAGWFEQKDGTAWCPEHVPDWVARWRAYQQILNDHPDAGRS